MKYTSGQIKQRRKDETLAFCLMIGFAVAMLVFMGITWHGKIPGY